MKYACEQCPKSFERPDLLKKHTKTHEVNLERFRCPCCQKTFTRLDNLLAHGKRFHPDDCPTPTKHQRQSEQATSSTTQNDQVNENLDDSFDEDQSIFNTQIKKLIWANLDKITTKRVKTSRVQDRYNFQTENPTHAELRGYLEEIFNDQRTSFKINISFGFILRNIQTQQLSFFYASNNNKLFSKPMLITSRGQIEGAVEAIDKEDLLEYYRQQRPNSTYTVETITNMLFYVDKLKNFRIGNCTVALPPYIKNNSGIIGLDTDWNGVPYADHLCLVRCLALMLGAQRSRVDNELRPLLLRWLQYCRTQPHTQFKGITLNELEQFENCFGIAVDVFELYEHSNDDDDDDDNDEADSAAFTVASRQIRRSIRGQHIPKLSVNVYRNHFSYIKSLERYCQRWACAKCTKLFSYKSKCLVHERSCDGSTKIRFKGGGFGAKLSIYDELVTHGLFVRPEHKFYPYRIAFDFEAFSKPIDQLSTYPKGATRVLKPASVSVCSNVPGFETAKCFLTHDEDYKALMGEFVTYILEISHAAASFLMVDRGYIMQQLEQKISRLEELKANATCSSDELEEQARLQIFEVLKTKFSAWLKSIVVLGFNSGKFDLNLIRSHLFSYLLDKGIPIRQIIKKGTSYQCIIFENFTFLDMRNYLSPTVSYEKWIKSLAIQQQKGFFPYEWFESDSDLDTPFLVPREAFWSSLKQCGITEEQYAYLQNVWKEQGLRTMKDLLIWYNNLDVTPFVEAAGKFFDHWRNLDIDPFKSGSISLPGLALTHLMKTLPKHVVLPLIPQKFEDVYYCIKANIVGGLSAVFHRYHEKDVTLLPNGEKCKIVTSKDANGLYLYCLGLPTGTGIMTLWRTYDVCKHATNSRSTMSADEIASWNADRVGNMSALFSRRSMYPMCQKELEWLEWYAHTNSCHVIHRFNGGQRIIKKSKTVKYPVDGFVQSSNTVLQFNGCYWHVHHCHLAGRDRMEQRYVETLEITENLKALGLNVLEMWECQWDALKRSDPEIRVFLEQHVTISKPNGSLTASNIINLVQAGSFFGLVECDIEVPRFDDSLNEYFQEFPPIFKNTEVSKEDIGDLMKNHADRFNFLKKPRRCLISSYYGRKILLSTPLLQWYLQKGLVVTRVYQVIQMKPKRCFQHLADEVTAHRKAADADPTLAPIGSTWKDTGNHYYGKTATDKFKHKQVTLADDATASRMINDKRFCSMEEVGETAYEMTMDKKSIKIDLPITVAFFVYCGAKLRMLEFVYDFLKKYLLPGSYQIVCMDTDSIIAAYASANIDDLVRSELKDEYLNQGKSKFLVTQTDHLRTPGLFKDELVADGVIALCSKTYFAWGQNVQKAVSKDLSKTTNNLTHKDYFDVLKTGVRGKGQNHGFKVQKDNIFQFVQERKSLSYLYIKRRVLSDGISTEPLDI